MTSINYQKCCDTEPARLGEAHPHSRCKLMDIPLNPFNRKPRPRCIPRPRPLPPVPVKFNFGFTGRHPLVPLAAAGMLLNRTTREVLALLDDGNLRWGFDIRTRAASRREVRILRQSVFQCAGLCEIPISPRLDATEFRQIVDLILPDEIIVGTDGADWKTQPQNGRNFQHESRLGSREYKELKLPKEPVLRATEIAECFCCIPQHVTNLIGDNFFRVLDLPIGPKASPFVTRESVIQFLKERRIS